MSYGICEGGAQTIVKPIPKPTPKPVYNIFDQNVGAASPTPAPTPCHRWCQYGYAPICAERTYRTTVSEHTEQRTFRTEACMNADTCVAGHSWKKVSEGSCPGDFRGATIGNNNMYTQPENYYQPTPAPVTSTPSVANNYLQQLLQKIKNPSPMPAAPPVNPSSGQTLLQQFLAKKQLSTAATPAPSSFNSNEQALWQQLLAKKQRSAATTPSLSAYNPSGQALMKQFLATKQLSSVETTPIPPTAQANPFLQLLAKPTQATPTINPLIQLYSSKMQNANPLLQNILQSSKRPQQDTSNPLAQFGLGNNLLSNSERQQTQKSTNPFLVGNKLPVPSANDKKNIDLLKMLG